MEVGTVGGIEVGGAALMENVGVDVPFLSADLLGIRVLSTYQNFGEFAIVLPCGCGVGMGLKTCYQLLFGAVEILFGDDTEMDGIGE